MHFQLVVDRMDDRLLASFLVVTLLIGSSFSVAYGASPLSRFSFSSFLAYVFQRYFVFSFFSFSPKLLAWLQMDLSMTILPTLQ